MSKKEVILTIKTELPNEAIIEILNNGTQNLKDLEMELLSIRIGANELIKSSRKRE